MTQNFIELILILAGLAHIGLAIGSLFIPKLLNWKSSLANAPLLIRQMFWTYAGYILCINVFFGVVSMLFPSELTSGSGLAKSLSLLIFLYWFVRVLIQFFYFDKSQAPKGTIYTIGDWVLNLLFIAFSGIYGYLFIYNFS